MSGSLITAVLISKRRKKDYEYVAVFTIFTGVKQEATAGAVWHLNLFFFFGLAVTHHSVTALNSGCSMLSSADK